MQTQIRIATVWALRENDETSQPALGAATKTYLRKREAAMNEKFWNQPASEVMSRVVVTIGDREKVESAAELMTENSINALPVLHESGSCIGILTSQDIVEYEAIRKDVENDYKHGYFFDLARYGAEESPAVARLRYDDVDHHMNRNVVIVAPDTSLSEVTEKMCLGHSHHAVVLDNTATVVGIVSTLDILAAVASRNVLLQTKNN